MSKKHLFMILIVLISLIVLTFLLQKSFGETTSKFEVSGGAFFLSIFFLFFYKNALCPMKKIGGPQNFVKKHYNKKGKLHKYKKLCKIQFVVCVIIGALALIYGLLEICIFFSPITI